MTVPVRPVQGDMQSDLLRRIDYLKDKLSMGQRFTVLGTLLVTLRDTFYPHMHILMKADRSMVVTITRPPQAGDQ